jgi:hypothetical protein
LHCGRRYLPKVPLVPARGCQVRYLVSISEQNKGGNRVPLEVPGYRWPSLGLILNAGLKEVSVNTHGLTKTKAITLCFIQLLEPLLEEPEDPQCNASLLFKCASLKQGDLLHHIIMFHPWWWLTTCGRRGTRISQVRLRQGINLGQKY